MFMNINKVHVYYCTKKVKLYILNSTRKESMDTTAAYCRCWSNISRAPLPSTVAQKEVGNQAYL